MVRKDMALSKTMFRRMAFPGMISIVLAGAAAFLLLPRETATAGSDSAIILAAADGAAEGQFTGPSGLPLPRFVSLKTDRVNVRRGPSTTHQVVWVFARKGLPVEIIAEFENWRRVRDSDGEEGWVFHSLLAGTRTALVAPWRQGERMTLVDGSSASASPVVVVESGVLGKVEKCDGQWCQISTGGFTGWMRQNMLWGVYPGEKMK